MNKIKIHIPTHNTLDSGQWAENWTKNDCIEKAELIQG